MTDKNRMKGFTYCGECVYYSHEEHKCGLGAKQETNPRDPFYDDCPIPDVEQLDAVEIRNKAIDEFAERLKADHEGIVTNWDKPYAITFERIDEIAEEMKAGIQNEN